MNKELFAKNINISALRSISILKTLIRGGMIMDITLDVARTSINLSEFKVQQAIDISMLKKTMETQEMQAENLIKDLPESLQLTGSIIDVKA